MGRRRYMDMIRRPPRAPVGFLLNAFWIIGGGVPLRDRNGGAMVGIGGDHRTGNNPPWSVNPDTAFEARFYWVFVRADTDGRYMVAAKALAALQSVAASTFATNELVFGLAHRLRRPRSAGDRSLNDNPWYRRLPADSRRAARVSSGNGDCGSDIVILDRTGRGALIAYSQ